MKAKALISYENRTFRLEEVEIPEPKSDEIAIRTAYSGVSIGTEFALIRGKISWRPFPLCTGYMGTGIVESVGEDIDDFSPGDRVYFRGNQRMFLFDGREVGCVQGAHCSHVVTKPHSAYGVGKLPKGAPLDLSALYVVFSVGLNGVDMVGPRYGDIVVVHGVGLVGLGVLRACVLRGCRVIAVDIHPRKLEIARALGAEWVIDGSNQDVVEEVRRIAPQGADVVFECTGLPACVDPAIELCRSRGKFVWQGNYGAVPVSFQFLRAHGRQLTMYFPYDDGLAPCRRAVIDQIAHGAFPVVPTITHRVPAVEAPEIFRQIDSDSREFVGVLISWGSTDPDSGHQQGTGGS